MGDTSPLILIVDDNEANLQLLGGLLEREGFDLAFATEGSRVFDFVRERMPLLILLDVMMPGMDGYAVCRGLKLDKLTAGIPIIFVTAKTRPEELVRGFEAGAVDYVTKPFNSAELLARVRTHIELRKTRLELEKNLRQLDEMNDRFLSAMKRLEELATQDVLTSLPNRRLIIQRMENEAERAKRNDRPFCVCILDIDFFKKVNDDFGHECGDFILVNLAEVLRKAVRAQDTVGRWGGEEFIILLPETAIEGASILADKIRSTVELNKFVWKNGLAPQITLTIGLARYMPESGIDDAIRRADDALYVGKRKGRNIVVAEEP